MNKLMEKIIAAILVVILMSANLIILGEYTIAKALTDDELNAQKTSTNNRNIEFNSYLNGGTHIEAFDIGSEDAKLYVNVKVENVGYLKDGTIEFFNTNFKLKDNISNENIQSVDTENNRIVLNKIDNGSDIILELPIEILIKDEIWTDYFNNEFNTKLTGTYVDENGKESAVEKEITNRLSWNGSAEAELKLENTKYIPYNVDNNYGVLLQTKVTSNIKDSALPIQNTNIQITVPAINNVKPTTVTVLSTKTEASNGRTDGLDFTNGNYSYDAEAGSLTINTANNTDNVSWKKNVVDEYLVTYLFEGQDIYNYVVENGVTTNVTATSQITVYNYTVFNADAEATLDINYTNEDEQVGNITDFSVVVPQELNKGYIYANYDAESKLETEYYTKYIATINSSKLTTSIELEQNPDQLITADNAIGSTTVNGENYAYNKRIEVSQSIFNKILGEDGTITINDESGNELGVINKDTTVENGNYVLDISSQNNNRLTMTTSDTITEGQFEVTVVKALKGEIDYSRSQMEDFTKMRANLLAVADATNASVQAETTLNEPVTRAEVTIEPQNLSTVLVNKDVEIRAVLDTSNQAYALYKNPVIEIELPEEVTNIELTSVDLLLDDELKIKSSEVVNENGRFVIRVELEGTQTKYNDTGDQTSISAGATIVMKADITLDTFASNGTETINMYYSNENSDLYANAVTRDSETVGQATTNADLVAPSGLTAANTLSGYDDEGSSIINISDEKQEDTIAVHSEAREITVGGTIVNNYSNDISNVVILGRFLATGNKNVDTNEDLGSTFDIPVSEEISVTGTENATIYYSENVDATNDLNLSSNGWTTSPSNLANVKSYMIVLNNNIAASGRVEFSYKATIPANLEYDNSAYEMYKVFYTNNSEEAVINETKVSSIIGLTTGQGPNLNVTMTSNVKQENGVNVIRQGSQVRIWATIENTGKLDANNVVLTINKPDEIDILQYDDSFSGYNTLESNQISVGTIAAGESVTVDFDIKLQNNFIVKDSTGSRSISLSVAADNMAFTANSEELTFNYNTAYFFLTNKPNVRESFVYTTNSLVQYEINFTAKTKELTNVRITVPLPNDVKEVNAYWETADGENTDGIQIESNQVVATKNSLESTNNTLIVSFRLGANTETRFSTQVSAQADITIENEEGQQENISTGVCYSNERFVNKGQPELTGRQLELDDPYIREGEEFIYQFEITVGGTGNQTNLIFKDTLPSELEFVRGNIDVIYPESEDDESIDISYENHVVTGTINRLKPNATINIEIVVIGHLESEADDEKEIVNRATVSTNQVSEFELNSVTGYLEYVASEHVDPDDPDDPDNPSTGDETNRISGVAWIDNNRDGRRDTEEQMLAGVQVMLLNSANNEIVKDPSTGNDQITTTSSDGRYSFRNVEDGEYIVVFLYDAGQYSITAYQSTGVEENVNSDAISMRITLNGEQRNAGVTDIITINGENARNIDIGLYTSEKFDLRIDKYISRVTLTTPTIGTSATDFDNSKLQRIEVLERNVNQSSAVVEFKIVVTNEGSIAGYAKKLVDHIPDYLSFNSELNPDWYVSDMTSDVYNASLANDKIEPGESREVSLILSLQITEENLWKTLTNTAEIYESYNEQGTPDIDSTAGNGATSEDDMSAAEIVISIVTGNTIIIYIVVALVIVAILGVGIYEIKKRVLDKK